MQLIKRWLIFQTVNFINQSSLSTVYCTFLCNTHIQYGMFQFQSHIFQLTSLWNSMCWSISYKIFALFHQQSAHYISWLMKICFSKAIGNERQKLSNFEIQSIALRVITKCLWKTQLYSESCYLWVLSLNINHKN